MSSIDCEHAFQLTRATRRRETSPPPPSNRLSQQRLDRLLAADRERALESDRRASSRGRERSPRVTRAGRTSESGVPLLWQTRVANSLILTTGQGGRSEGDQGVLGLVDNTRRRAGHPVMTRRIDLGAAPGRLLDRHTDHKEGDSIAMTRIQRVGDSGVRSHLRQREERGKVTGIGTRLTRTTTGKSTSAT